MSEHFPPEDMNEYPVSQALELIELQKTLWEVTTLAMTLPTAKYPLSAENEQVGKQLGRLIRVLERRNIRVIDEADA